MGYTDGLGKWARIQVKGLPLTREQTNEVMMRTNYWPFTSSNDHEWEHVVASILGWYDRHDEVCDDDECPQWWEWVRESNSISDAYGTSISSLDLVYLSNDSIMSHNAEGPDGWLSWDGTVRGDWTVGKYPEVNELQDELEAIAAAFPFLFMEVQALSGGWSCEGVVEPKGTVVAHWHVMDGQVYRRGFPDERFYPESLGRRWSDWLYGESRSGRLALKVKWSKPWEFAARPYWVWRRWRNRVRRLYPVRVLGWWRPFEERHVSAARLIEADNQMRGKR